MKGRKKDPNKGRWGGGGKEKCCRQSKQETKVGVPLKKKVGGNKGGKPSVYFCRPGGKNCYENWEVRNLRGDHKPR